MILIDQSHYTSYLQGFLVRFPFASVVHFSLFYMPDSLPFLAFTIADRHFSSLPLFSLYDLVSLWQQITPERIVCNF